MGLSLHWWSQRWEALLQQWGEWGGRFCQNAECSVHQGLGKQGDQEVNWGLSTLVLVASSLITLWSVKSSSRAQARVPKGQQWLCLSSSPGQPDSSPLTTLLSLRSHPPDSSCSPSWQPHSLEPPGTPALSSQVRNLTLWVSVAVTFHPSGGGSGTQVWHLCLLHQRHFYVTEISFSVRGRVDFPHSFIFHVLLLYLCRNWHDRMVLVLENGFLTDKRSPQQIIYIPTMERHSACI